MSEQQIELLRKIKVDNIYKITENIASMTSLEDAIALANSAIGEYQKIIEGLDGANTVLKTDNDIIDEIISKLGG